MAEQTVALNVRYDSDGKTLVSDVQDIERAFRRLDDQTKKNQDGFKKASQDSRTLGKDLRALRGVLGTVAKAVGAMAAVASGAAAAALVSLTRQGLQTADALGKTADKLGITTEALAGLRVAAERSGVSANQFDTALQRLVRRTAEAAQGTGEAKAALETLGLSAQELVRLSPDQMLARVADAMAGVEGQSQRVALAFKLFDTEGVALVNTLANGSAGLDSFRQKAEIAGVTLDRTTVAGIERANDAMADLQLLQQGFGQQLAAKFAPILQHIAERLFAVAEEAGGMGKVAERVFNFLIEGAAQVASVFDGIVVVVNTLRAAFFALARVAGFFIEDILRGDIFISTITFQTERVKNLERFLVEVQERNAELAELATRSWERAGEALADFGQTGEQVRLVLDDIEKKSYISEVYVTGYNRVEGSINGAVRAAENLADANVVAAQQTAAAWTQAGNQIAGTLQRTLAGQIQGFIGGGGGFAGALSGAFSNAVAGSVLSGGRSGGGPGLGLLAGLAGGLGSGVGSLFANVSGGLSGLSVRLLGENNVLQNLLGRQFSATNAFGQSLGFQGAAATGIGALASIGGGLLGSFGGNKLGEALFGKVAESNFGSIAGGIIGSFGGPIGSFVGSAIGSLLDVAFGGDGKKRFNIGIRQGTGLRPGDNLGQVVRGASGLQFQTVNRRAGAEGDQAAQQFLDAVLGLDAALTTLTQGAGINVDFSRRTLRGGVADAGRSGVGNFFGLKGFNGVEGSLEDAAADFVGAWLEEVNAELPKRVRDIMRGIDGTAEELVSAFEAAISIDRLLNLDVVRETDRALKELEQANLGLLESYDDLTEQLLEAASAGGGSAASLAQLNEILGAQKVAAAQLAAAYRTVGIEVDALLGSTIQSIRESVLSDEELYALRQQQIAELMGQLTEAVSPEQIQSLVGQIDQLARGAFGLLDEGQQAALADQFVGFLTQAEELAQQRINAALGDLASREQAVQQTLDLELQSANVQMQAAQQNLTASQNFLASAQAIEQALRNIGRSSGSRFLVGEVNR